jgi:hypothetical protein
MIWHGSASVALRIAVHLSKVIEAAKPPFAASALLGSKTKPADYVT